MSRFIQIAMGSAAELSYHILLARDLGFLKCTDHVKLDSEVNAILRMLSGLSAKVRKTEAA